MQLSLGLTNKRWLSGKCRQTLQLWRWRRRVDAADDGMEGVAEGETVIVAGDGVPGADVAGTEVPVKRKRGRPPKNASAVGAGRAALEKKAKEPKPEPKAGPAGAHAPAAASLEPRRRGRPPKRYLDADEDARENDQKQQRGSRGRPPKRFRDEAEEKAEQHGGAGHQGPKDRQEGSAPEGHGWLEGRCAWRGWEEAEQA